MTKLPANLKRLIQAERARRSLVEYTKQAWHTTEPGDYLHNWSIEAVADALTAVTHGEIRRLLINIPPRNMKSLSVAVMWPTWEWLDHPELRYMFASYSAELSTRDNVKSRDVILSPWYQETVSLLYPNAEDRWALKGDQNVKMRYENTRGGHRIATSVGGKATGDGGDRVVVDDPHSVTEGDSEVKREATLLWWDRTMSSRLNNQKTGAKIIIMQRVHEKDLSGHVLAEGGYEHLCLPMEYSPKIYVEGRDFEEGGVAPDPRWPDPRSVAGESLWPERFPAEVIASLKKDLGSYGYSGQYQQSPSPEGGGMLKRGWWKYYKALPTLDEILMSWDCSFKDSDGSDYVVGEVWGRKGADAFLIDLVRDRMDFPATLVAVRAFVNKHPRARLKLIEDKANGPAVISSLKREIPGIVAVEPDGSKIARVSAISPFVEAGNVWLPDPKHIKAPWLSDFIDECAAFPLGDHDDMVDSMSQALNRMLNRLKTPVVTMDDLKAAAAREE